MYNFLFITILVLGILLSFVFKNINKSESGKKIFLIVLGVIVVFISGFRGDFTVDYGNYSYIFYHARETSLANILKGDRYAEVGFTLFNKLVGIFTSNYSGFLVIISIIIIGVLFQYIKLYSPYVVLSSLLLFSYGSYFTSFNTLRQYFVSILFLISMRYIYDKAFFKYLISILIFSLIHSSILFMLPFYFILQIRWSSRKNFLLNIGIIGMISIIGIFSSRILSFITRYVYQDYASTNSFGVSTGTPIITILRPLVIFIFIIILYKNIDFSRLRELVWLNSIIFWLIFSIFATQIELLQRLTYFFIPPMIVLLPLLVSRIKSKDARILYYITVFLYVLIYGVINNLNLPYTFIWS